MDARKACSRVCDSTHVFKILRQLKRNKLIDPSLMTLTKEMTLLQNQNTIIHICEYPRPEKQVRNHTYLKKIPTLIIMIIMCNFYIAPFHTKCSERITQLLPRQACAIQHHLNFLGSIEIPQTRGASTLNNQTRSFNCL